VEEIFRHWVEIRDLQAGTVRELPLKVMQRIHIPTKRNLEPRPPEQVLEIKDTEGLLEATDLDDLIQRLRERYPDALFERTLKQELDQAATERRAEAINELARIVARAAVRNLAKSKSVP